MSTQNMTNDIAGMTLAEICDRIVALDVAYDDVADRIEDLAYIEYGHGGIDEVMRQLERLARFLENLRNKNEEICRDLAHVYLLVGQIYQFAGLFDKSIEWINKSIIVDDMYSVSYHALAISFMSIGDESLAIKSLEQEILVEPGNYYTYLLLADIYDKNRLYDKFEDVIRRLLERDPTNIRGIHKLIRFRERDSEHADVELLRRRLLSRADGLSRMEAMIRAYHLTQAGRHGEAIDFLALWSLGSPDVSITHLANAYIYGLTHQYSKKRRELLRFTRKNHGYTDVMETKINEFETVFGSEAADNLRRRLHLVDVSVGGRSQG